LRAAGERAGLSQQRTPKIRPYTTTPTEEIGIGPK
jgi:hypothetical protein